jgi:hypothetical protein
MKNNVLSPFEDVSRAIIAENNERNANTEIQATPVITRLLNIIIFIYIILNIVMNLNI